MILDPLIVKLKYDTIYLVELQIDENAGKCQTQSVIYEDKTKIDCVRYWAKM